MPEIILDIAIVLSRMAFLPGYKQFNFVALLLFGLYISWESFYLMHDSFSHIISARPAILCFFPHSLHAATT